MHVSAPKDTSCPGADYSYCRIRDDNMSPCTGVTIEDMGHKMGCNGVDNGKLSFHNYAVPRESLLNAFSDVQPDGSFSSSIPKPRDRFLKVSWCCGIIHRHQGVCRNCRPFQSMPHADVLLSGLDI